MNKSTSVLLDFLRVVAALGVVLVHSGPTRFSHLIAIDPDRGHYCVVIFFVLSGYVISHSIRKPSLTPRSYAIARLSRLYSVLLPALVVTALLLILGRQLNPSFYQAFDRGREPARFALSALYLQESWNLSAAPPTNIPLWSLAYEFWYYVLFGVLWFSRSRGLTLALIVAIAAATGPKMLLLLPTWLMGVAALRLGLSVKIGRSWAASGGALAAAAALLWTAKGPEYPWRIGYPPFYFSNAFVSDLLLSVLVATTIYCFDQAVGPARMPEAPARIVRRGADMTFSLYLLHYPFLIFAAAVVPYDHSNWRQTVAVLAAIFLAIGAVSRVTEAKRRILAEYLDRRLPGTPGAIALPARAES